MRPFRSALLSSLFSLPLVAFAQTTHVENVSFKADVTSFHTSIGSNGLRYITATIHLTNVGKNPLILSCDPSKSKGADDQGNPYGGAKFRGIGTINGSGVDTKFVLAPKASGDILVEEVARFDARTVRGVAFDLTIPVSEVALLPSKQAKVGVERTMEFTGLKSGFTASKENKVDAGPFTAEVVRKSVIKTPDRRWKSLEMTVKLTNTSDKPLILAYEYKSSYGLDDQGNRFFPVNARSGDGSATGIGIVSDSSADPQFVLAPGESREIKLSTSRRLGSETDGTEYMYYVNLQQLETLASGQIHEVRQFSITFPGLKN